MSYENIPQTVSAALLSISDNPVVILILHQRDSIDCRDLYGHDARCLDLYPDLPADSDGAIRDGPGAFRDHDGIEPLWGLCTPPVGSVLFIGCSVAGTKIDQVIRPLLPMFAAMVIVLFLVAFLPDLSLLIPRLFGL